MTLNECVNLYIEKFKYKEVLFPEIKHKKSYLKHTKEGFIFLESLENTKTVTFYFNNQVKKFKKSDLVMCVLENTPAGWEAENE